MPLPGEDLPIAKVLWNTVSLVSQAFDQALGEVGGSRPTWFILLSLKCGSAANQRELAANVGIQGATLTHHLTAMEADGLITRRRDPANRRVHQVDLTAKGETAFLRMREAAIAFDHTLRDGIPDDDVARLRDTLDRLRANVE